MREEEDGSFTKIIIYVDDSLYFNSGPKYKYYVKKLEKELQHRFDVDFQGQAHWFLSMRIGRDSVGNVTLDQARYVANIVKRFLGESVSVENVKRPLPSDFVATVQDCSTSAAEVAALTKEYRMEYPSVIGSLIYLLNSRPDICFAVSKLAKFMRSPGRKHFQALVHLLQYLKCHRRLGIKYYHDYKNSPIYSYLREHGTEIKDEIFGMHDSSWQDCPDTGRSTGCYFNFIAGGIVDFSSFVPAPVALSSTEAEMNAGAVGGMGMSYVRMLWNDLHGEDPDILWDPPISMFCDNSGAVTFANSDKDSKALRHTKRRMFFMRQSRKEKELQYFFIDNDYMFADIGTKNTEINGFELARDLLLVEVPE